MVSKGLRSDRWQSTTSCLHSFSDDPPLILDTTQPEDQLETTPGSNVSFRVNASGTDLIYQWRRGQSDLSDTEKFLGTDTRELTVVAVEEADEGNYSCTVQNLLDSVSSRAALLTICEYSLSCIFPVQSFTFRPAS